MNQSPNYTVEDVEKFLEVNDREENSEQSQSLRKLLNVKDKISIFKNIDSAELKAIIYDLKFMKFKYKEYIVKENDESINIFFIIDGECQVFHDKKKVGTLRPGEIFGESGVIFKTKRNASVICASENATLLSFCIDDENMEFCSLALAKLYKNLAFEINAKLEDINSTYTKK